MEADIIQHGWVEERESEDEKREIELDRAIKKRESKVMLFATLQICKRIKSSPQIPKNSIIVQNL